jgi:catechol 2,3-dioxygenase-like lactoylglutathione lyase family enzyme
VAIAPRVSLVTLGVRDADVAEAFYRALGWEIAFNPDWAIGADGRPVIS